MKKRHRGVEGFTAFDDKDVCQNELLQELERG
jgi:hypothetical protein